MRQTLPIARLRALAVLTGVLFFMPQLVFGATATITIGDNSYTPKNITIAPGDTVSWKNNGTSPHTIVADDKSFESVTLAPGQTFAAMFNLAGSYPYHCRLHGGVGGVGQSGVIAVVAPAPITSTNSTVAALQAQLQALMNQVNVLKGQPSTTASATATQTSGACPNIGRVLKKGATGADVTRLQQFLAGDPSVYPEGIVSGYYGALTEKAVQRWQAKYNVVSSGTPETTGYGVVGPRTAAAIAILCSTGSYGGVSAPGSVSTAPQVGGLITVSPVSGSAPLAVNVSASVNTTNSCQAATYTLSFGDNSLPVEIPVIAGTCQQVVKSIPHTYKYGGSYTVKLSAGGHETTATVLVDGPPPPVITPGLPKESFNVSPLSGAAPLTVTFSGVVNSNNAGFCTEGCAAVLDFGDGNQERVDLPGSVGGWLNYSVNHTYTQSGGFRATLYQGGAGPSQPIVGSATIVVGFPPSTSTTTAPSTTTGTATSYNYSAPVVSPTGTDPMQFSIAFDLPSSCAGFSLDWGDNYYGNVGQADGGLSCAQVPIHGALTHVYSRAGTYNIILMRGPSLSRIDQSTLTIGQ